MSEDIIKYRLRVKVDTSFLRAIDRLKKHLSNQSYPIEILSLLSFFKTPLENLLELDPVLDSHLEMDSSETPGSIDCVNLISVDEILHDLKSHIKMIVDGLNLERDVISKISRLTETLECVYEDCHYFLNKANIYKTIKKESSIKNGNLYIPIDYINYNK